jgi:CcmD family protein
MTNRSEVVVSIPVVAIRVLWVMSVAVTSLAPPAFAWQPQGEPQGEFVPVSELPPGDELPAAPLLIAAYAFVWIALFVYLWALGRRIRRADDELAVLRGRFESRR